MSNSSEPKHSKPVAAISLIIGIGALIAFFVLNRMMAPPFPNFPTSKGATNSAATTNDTR